jgi:thiamine pyrophosphokinase
VALILDGDRPVDGWPHLLAPDAQVVAADGGARHARHAGIRVDHLVGDLDSLSDDDIGRLQESGAVVHRHPRCKDETDFELAADVARGLATADATRSTASGRVAVPALLVVGGSGGRLDHLLGNLMVLAGPCLASVAVTALMGDAVVQVARSDRPVQLFGAAGSLASLYPVGEPAIGVTTDGLQYALRDESLSPGSARGTSNVVRRAPASVRLSSGALLVVEPGAIASLIPTAQEQP